MNRVLNIILCMLVIGINSVMAETVTYTADNTTIFPNPERGFTDEIQDKISDSDPSLLVGNEDFFDQSGERQSQRLVVLVYYLTNYRDKALSQAMLNGFDADMQVLRDKGFKCVLRFAYCESDKSDAPLSRVQQHLTQLKQHLADNADVIYVLEAGFVGRWGEWYYSQNFGNESQHLNNDRRAVIDALLDAVPEDRFLLVRYPLIKIEYQGDEIPLTRQQAYGNTPRARIGHHNDAFLNDWGDEGTYSRDDNETDDDPVLRQYIADETLYVPNGGETNIESSSVANRNATYDLTTQAMARYHWSFCGAEYAETTTNKWRQNGTFDELNRRMGYRYQLVDATLPQTAVAGAQISLTINIANVGYAPLYNKRHVYLVLKNGQDTYPVKLNSDPRQWLPNGVVTTLTEQVTLPQDMPQGTYQLYLFMPDAYESLANNPKYAIRFANVGTWDALTGMNSLNAEVAVTAQQSALPVITDEGKVLIGQDTKIYDAAGNNVTVLNGKLPTGVYIIRNGGNTSKVIVK